MGKVFIVLDEEEQVKAERACLDRDRDAALEFVLRCVVPKMRKKLHCLDGALKVRRGDG